MSGYRSTKLKTGRTCEVHGEQKEFFCVARECMTDLCRLCMRFHNELHNEHNTSPAIENYEQTMAISLEKLNRMIWGYNNEIKRLEQSKGSKENEWEAFINEIRQKVLKSKRTIETFVDAYFNEIENELLNQYLYPSKKMSIDKLETPIQKLVLKVEKLEHVKRYLTKDQKEKEMIKYVFFKDDRYILDNLKNKVDELINKESIFTANPDKIEVICNKEHINDFYKVLSDFVTLNVDLKDLTTDAGTTNLNTFGDITQEIHPDNSILNNYRDNLSSLNNSLGQGKEETRKIPNPYPKDNLRNLSSYQPSNSKNQTAQNTNSKSKFTPQKLDNQKSNAKFKIFDETDEDEAQSQNQKFDNIRSGKNDIQNTPFVSQQKSQKGLSEILMNKKPRLDEIKEEISIQTSNFFDKDSICKILHFFEPKTKNFYYVQFPQENADLMNSSRNFVFTKVELNIDFYIKRHTRSIANKLACIVLIGGLLENITDGEKPQIEFFKNVYLMDFQRSTLLEMEEMNHARAAHSVVLIDNNILVTGGITENCVVSDTCEWYSFEENKWIEIDNMKEATMNSTLSLVHDRYVVKFGGKLDEKRLSDNIEILDLSNLKWSILKKTLNFPIIPSLACAVEIKSGQVLFFGGIYESVSEKSDLIYSFNFNENGSLVKISQQNFTLPAEDGFWDQQAIIHNEGVFALQNISNPQKRDSFFMNNRRIIMIDNSNCRALN